MSRIEILDVENNTWSVPAAARTGISSWPSRAWRRLTSRPPVEVRMVLERPRPGETIDAHVLPVSGWAFSTHDRVRAILVEHFWHGQRIEVRLPRADVAAAHPAASGGPRFGFIGGVSLLGLPRETELPLTALLENGTRVPVGAIRLKREPLVSGYEPRRRPLLLNGFGRSGSSWVMRLLREHPQIVVAGCFPHEVRAGQYWARLANFLAQPFGTDIDPRPRTDWPLFDPRGWGGVEAEEMSAWFGNDYVEELAASMQARTDDYYDRVARILGRSGADVFAEKAAFLSSVRLMEELYPETCVVHLVRDFRDMYCSMRSFNDRRGFLAFGRERVGTDEEFIAQLAKRVEEYTRHFVSRGDAAILIRYEDLIRRPHRTLERLFSSIGLDADADAIDGVLARASVETEVGKAHRTTASADRSIGRWREDLPPQHRRAVQAAFGPMLETFGYEDVTSEAAAFRRAEPLRDGRCRDRAPCRAAEAVPSDPARR